jgi:hypothetical protein
VIDKNRRPRREVIFYLNQQLATKIKKWKREGEIGSNRNSVNHLMLYKKIICICCEESYERQKYSVQIKQRIP